MRLFSRRPPISRRKVPDVLESKSQIRFRREQQNFVSVASVKVDLRFRASRARHQRQGQPGMKAVARDAERSHIRSTAQIPRCFGRKDNLASTSWRRRPRSF